MISSGRTYSNLCVGVQPLGEYDRPCGWYACFNLCVSVQPLGEYDRPCCWYACFDLCVSVQPVGEYDGPCGWYACFAFGPEFKSRLLGSESGYPELCSSRFSSVSPGKCPDITKNWATTTSFHILCILSSEAPCSLSYWQRR
jgi:hypothetical protein